MVVTYYPEDVPKGERESRHSCVFRVEALSGKRAFSRVLSAKNLYHSSGFIIFTYWREDDSSLIRAGFTVSRKIDKRACVRNRIKRRLRALVRDVFSNYTKGGYDFVFISRRRALDLPFATMKTDLLKAIKKLGCYK